MIWLAPVIGQIMEAEMSPVCAPLAWRSGNPVRRWRPQPSRQARVGKGGDQGCGRADQDVADAVRPVRQRSARRARLSRAGEFRSSSSFRRQVCGSAWRSLSPPDIRVAALV